MGCSIWRIGLRGSMSTASTRPAKSITGTENRADNRIANLRDIPPPQNRWNAVPRGRSGVAGVSRRGAKWRAKIIVNGRLIHLGTYDSRKEAAAAYRCAARLLRGEFARNARPRMRGPRFVLVAAAEG